jgi:uncharacterized GH25 family protein
MKRLSHLVTFAVVFGLTCAAPARAHFVWLLPWEEAGKEPAVRLLFSEDLRVFDPDLLSKIAHAEVFVRNADDQTRTIKTVFAKDQLKATMPAEVVREVGAVCRYGVFQRGGVEPFLLNYYAKTFVGLEDWANPPGLFGKAWDKLPLEIVPVLPKKDAPRLRVLWRGKPVADAEVVLLVPGIADKVEARTDKDGVFSLTPPKKGGFYGLRVLHKEARAGEYKGKKYKEVRHYATLVLRIPERAEAKASDPAATKLLADARAARALYRDFPGFRADVEINLDGKATRGQVEVSAKGKVALELVNAEAEKWAKHTLSSVIGHRLSSGPDEETPCAFVDKDTHHPLGRAIRVLNDEFHSSYRIRDRQVLVVNRRTPEARFTITVMENVLTREKKYLPVSYTVTTWDPKTEALISSETYHHTWQRVGDFDLPKETLAVKATAGKLQAKSIKLSNVHLN